LPTIPTLLNFLMPPKKKKHLHLEIANYPPPFDGWGTHTQFVVEEIRRRGYTCMVLKINENRQIKSPDYVDVQNGIDYLVKVIRFAASGYTINVHVNAESSKGYILALVAVLVGRLFLRKSTVTFHGGVPQSFFPKPKSSLWYWKFKFLFTIASGILCDSDDIKRPIASYAVCPAKIGTASGFSKNNLAYKKVEPSAQTEAFLQSHAPVFFCYVSFRPEYHLEVLREGMKLFRENHPQAGFIWLGFPDKEMLAVREYISSFALDEQESLLLLENLNHNEFMTLLSRCTAKLRTPACDGVSASVLESLALGIPVVASENGRRPAGVITYAEKDAADMCVKLEYLLQNFDAIKQRTVVDSGQDNVKLTADWLLGE